MSILPTGSAFLMGLGREAAFGVPAPGLLGFAAVLPVEAEMSATESASGQVDPSGYARPGVPGPITGAIKWGHPWSAVHFLEIFEHLLGRSEKVELAPGGPFRYRFFPSLRGSADTSFWGLFAKGETEVWARYGIKFSQLQLAIGNNTEIVAKVDGDGVHGTFLGPVAADPANLGTYTAGPWIRGTLADPFGGDVWLRVEAASPPAFKVLQSHAEPSAGAWAAAPLVFAVEVRQGGAVWQALQASDDGRDLGVVDLCNKDPLEVIFPGSWGDDGELAAGDLFRFPRSWSPPELPLLPEGGCFTSAHWQTEVGEVGGELLPVAFDSGTVTLGWPLKAQTGNGSRYRHALHRTGKVVCQLQLERPLEDTFFAAHSLRRRQVAMRTSWVGRQLEGGFREAIEIACPSLTVTASQRPAANADLIEETVTFAATTDHTGRPPFEVVVTTERDFQPAPQG